MITQRPALLLVLVAAIFAPFSVGAQTLWDYQPASPEPVDVDAATVVKEAVSDQGCQLSREYYSPYGLSPSGQTAVLKRYDGLLTIDTTSCASHLWPELDDVLHLDFTSDEEVVVLRDAGRILERWSLTDQRRRSQIELSEDTNHLTALATDGDTVVVGLNDRLVLLDGQDNQRDLPLSEVDTLRLSGSHLLAKKNRQLQLIDLRSGELTWIDSDPQWSTLGPLVRDDAGELWAWMGRHDGTIEKVALNWSGERMRFRLPRQVGTIHAIAALNGQLVVGHNRPWLSVLSADGAQEIARLEYSGPFFAAAGESKVLTSLGILWDTDTWQAHSRVATHALRVIAVDVDQDRVATIDRDGILVLREGNQTRRFLLDERPTSVSLGRSQTPAEGLVAVGTLGAALIIYPDGRRSRLAVRRSEVDIFAAFSPDGRWLVAASNDRPSDGQIWSVQASENRALFEEQGSFLSRNTRELSFGTNFVLVNGSDVKLVRLSDGTELQSVPGASPNYGLSVALLDDRYVLRVQERNYRLFLNTTGQLDADWPGPISPDGKTGLAYLREGEDFHVVVFDMADGGQLQTIRPSGSLAVMVWISNNRLLIAHEDGSIETKNVRTGRGWSPRGSTHDLLAPDAGN